MGGVAAYVAGIPILGARWTVEAIRDIPRRRRVVIVGLSDLRFTIDGYLSDRGLDRLGDLDGTNAVNVTLRHSATGAVYSGPAWLDLALTPYATVHITGVLAGAWRKRKRRRP